MPKVKKVKGQVARPGVPLEMRVEDLERNIAPLYGAVNNPLAQETALGFALREVKARGLANEEAICPRVAARLTALEKLREREQPIIFDTIHRLANRVDALEKQEAATAAHVVKLLMAQRAAGRERLVADLKQEDSSYLIIAHIMREVRRLPVSEQVRVNNLIADLVEASGRGG